MNSKKSLGTYLSLCTEYYELDKPVAPKESFDFFLSYVKASKGPILEPMCGTGRFLIPFLEAGYQVDGIDASPHMLKKLYQKCESKNLKPNVHQAFLQDIEQGRQYDLIYIPCGSFGLITDLNQAKICLRKIWEHLDEGGIFVCEVETKNFISTNFGSQVRSTKTMADGKKIIFNLWPRPFENNIDTMLCHYELLDKDCLLQEETELFQVRLYDHSHFQGLLQEAGFSNIRMLKAFDKGKEPNPQDETVIYECTKKT